MAKISFSYIFNEDFNRIFECFSNANISINNTFKDLITNFKFIKGENLDEENVEFLIQWKNYYEIKCMVDKIIRENFFKSLIIRTTNIDKIPLEIILLFNFYWDNIDEKTIFIFEIKFQDLFFKDLIISDFNEDDKLMICKNTEKYLSTSLKGLERCYSCLINNITLEETWKYISHPKLFFEIVTKDFIFFLKKDKLISNHPLNYSLKIIINLFL